ncbi:unnamed protein product, partial [Darwinula stevensoni]
FMKKLLAVAAAATVLSSSAAFAQAEDIFYIKGNIGASKLNRVTDKISTVKLKSKTAAFFGIGGGYHIMDNMRADLMVDWKDFGKTKSQKSYTFNGTKIDGTVERSKTAYKGHHFTFGFRFDI